MKKYAILGIFVIAAVLMAGCTQSTQSGQTPGLGNHVVSTVNQNNVTVKNYQFNPQFLTIPQGANVTWINQDSSSGAYLSLIHISEPTRRTPISYAVFCLKKKKK